MMTSRVLWTLVWVVVAIATVAADEQTPPRASVRRHHRTERRVTAALTATTTTTTTTTNENLSPVCPQSSLPKVSDINGLNGTEMNIVINRAYNHIANCFQVVLLGGRTRVPDSAALSRRIYNWYAVAPYASRVVGMSEFALVEVVDALKHRKKPLTTRSAAGVVRSIISALCIGRRAGNLTPFFTQPSLLEATIRRLVAVLTNDDLAPASAFPTLLDKVRAIPRTLLNTLTQGNRAIFLDCGRSAIEYLRWRFTLKESALPPSVERIITDFALTPRFTKRSQVSREGIMKAVSFAKTQQRDRKNRFDLSLNATGSGVTGQDMMIAAFCLYEMAGDRRNTRITLGNNYIRMANNFIAYQEQKWTVKYVFTPGYRLEGEVRRPKLFSLLTASVHLDVPSGVWTFAEFARRKRWRMSEHHWWYFKDRWRGIMDSFEHAYKGYRVMFPMPNPDPRVPIEHRAPKVNVPSFFA